MRMKKTAEAKQSKHAQPIGDRLLTLRDAAEILRLSTRTVRDYLRRGEITGKIIGKQWRFRRADLDAFFENAPSEWDFDGKESHGD
jgi:excisionase family DNA binding protein